MMAEKVYLLIYILAYLIVGLQMIVNYKSYGDAQNLELSMTRAEMVWLLILSIIILILCYYTYKLISRKTLVIARFPKFEFEQKKIHVIVCVLLIIKIIVAYFGVGVASASGVRAGLSKISFVFSIITIESFFPIYYVIARNTQKKLYWINIILFSILRLIQGWSSFLLQIALFELFFWEKKRKKEKAIKNSLTTILLGPLAVFGGALIYKLIYPIKNYIRYGGTVALNYFSLSYGAALVKLIERLTPYPMMVASVQNVQQIVHIYKMQGLSFVELKAFFRPLIPSFIYHNKNFRTVNNMALMSIYPEISNATSSDLGIVGYSLILIKSNFMEFIMYIILLIILSVLTISFLKAFDNNEGDVRILIFILILNIVTSCSLEVCFSYGYIGSLYVFFILLLAGGIKIKKE